MWQQHLKDNKISDTWRSSALNLFGGGEEGINFLITFLGKVKLFPGLMKWWCSHLPGARTKCFPYNLGVFNARKCYKEHWLGLCSSQRPSAPWNPWPASSHGMKTENESKSQDLHLLSSCQKLRMPVLLLSRWLDQLTICRGKQLKGYKRVKLLQ